jgi:dTDP-4-amino-4,6-dideoxygalactose transaminase
MSSPEPRRIIGLGTADITDLEVRLVTDCLKSRRISPGPVQREFEEKVCALHGMPYGTFVASGQSALHLALEVLKIHKPNIRRVLCPAVTYISTLHAVWNAGLEVVLCDVDPVDFNLDLKALLPEARDHDVVMPVDLFGKAARIPRQDKPVVEDACESFAAPGVGYGDLVALSFYVAHTITTGSGGMVLTRDAGFDEDVKRLCNHGRTRGSDLYSAQRSESFDKSKKFVFEDVAFSFKLSDFNAALGLGQAMRIREILDGRRRNSLALREALAGYPQLQTAEPEGHTFMMFPIRCREKGLKPRLVAHLNDWWVETRDAMPITSQPIVKRMLGDVQDRYPVARDLNENGFYIAAHQHLTPEDMDYLVSVFRRFFKG